MNARFLRVTEIFYSIQGESATVGIPTTFIRLTGCPLRCTYCDTEYAFTGGEKISLEDILARTAGFPTRYVTVTGGEPLAQKNCVFLLDRLIENGYLVSLETGGAMDVSAVNPNVVKVMDLKTPSSGEEHRNRYENIRYLDKKDQVKFVIGTRDDYLWARETLKRFALDERCGVLFSPVTGCLDAARLADSILEDGLPVRFQIQLHKVLWGDVAGK
ncbi:MAG: 7-carboxy-7-deazaguanine synthase QueE [Methylococcaceae bacterium]|nr:7-carboxy-7-deazaguanine synthase QueE [Methylococcaceae bacterium]MCI0668631.1 7-carboxy-7-deazaguanine synthase QueE [Methylococcaceae bacterium]MCI0733087.1 7-carboxy-7-deazaguanine synthase QueE [Methylococcaceae bacterium]